MKYEELKGLKDKKFKRLIGVKREVFEFQIAILEEALKEKHHYYPFAVNKYQFIAFM